MQTQATGDQETCKQELFRDEKGTESSISTVNSNSQSRLRLVACLEKKVYSACKSMVVLGLLNGWGPEPKAKASCAEMLMSRKDTPSHPQGPVSGVRSTFLLLSSIILTHPQAFHRIRVILEMTYKLLSP